MSRTPPISTTGALAITNTRPIVAELKVTDFFNTAYKDAHLSPVDQFLANSNSINLIYVTQTTITPVLASILLLGYMSAVESYMRATIRRLIIVDPTCRKSVDSHQISFAAATSHKKDILPEALLEEVSFASADNIKKTSGKYLGLQPSCFGGMEKHFDEFEKLCQLRHCSTHRFGKLGTKNWLALGLYGKGKFLEKPLNLKKVHIEDAALLLRNFVKSINNVFFDAVLARTVVGGKTANQHIAEKIDWQWTFERDKSKFLPYYAIFASTEDAEPSQQAAEVYEIFKANYKKD